MASTSFGSVIFTLAVAVQPFASVTVILYVPALKPFALYGLLISVAVMPPVKLYGAVPPVMVISASPSLPPKQLTARLCVAVATGLSNIVKLTVLLLVQPMPPLSV